MPEEPEPILPLDLFVSPITCLLDDDIRAGTEEEPAPPGGPDGKAYVPTSLRLSLLDSVHASPGSGHPGRQRTLSLLKERYWWPNVAEDVARFVRGCSVCAMVSTSRRLSEDRFSKACKLIPLKGLPTALETAEAVFRHFGIPEDIVSDRGPQFISRVWRGSFKLLGASVSLSSGYHPQTKGQTERKIQEIRRYLRAYCHDHQHDWSQYLPWAEYVQNSVRQESTKLTPFQCILGYQPPLFPWSAEPSEVPTVDHWFRESERVEVWLSTRDMRLRLPCKKLSPRYIGPFTSLRQINDVTTLQTLSWIHYRANRSVDDAVNMALHFILQHLDSTGSYARILFVDFSSAFNTIVTALLRDKLFQLNVPDSMCSWITDFLKDRRQFLRLGMHVSDFQHISTGSLQGCVFSLYTNGCTSGHQSVKLLKFADDTALIGLISDGIESAYRGEMDHLVSWCSMNNLELNSLKTVEMIVDFRKDPAPLPLCDSPMTSVESFCFLGTTITQELKWEQNISSLTKKAQQRMYFLWQLKKFLLPVKMLVNFYTAIIESILTSSITVWFAAATSRDKAKLQCVIHSAEKVSHLSKSYTSPGPGDMQPRSQPTPLIPEMNSFSPSPLARGSGPSGPGPHTTRTVSAFVIKSEFKWELQCHHLLAQWFISMLNSMLTSLY
ncbi:hypothetical protein QTP70_002406 [Hemibagrus guttatus]|uniref:Gypsy retrotransposon integrase-like protein 1 n=1 Tax=Hemibagrus guttatus TaxID=175788 RepID=A0AAE0RBB9_9TELE|nr:hypothetical protein QTP70_002406 [Hemibagrus guttatus]